MMMDRVAAYVVWGANTGVGKTLVSAALAAACRRQRIPFAYIKPVQTGLEREEDADGHAVARALGDPNVHTVAPHGSTAPRSLSHKNARVVTLLPAGTRNRRRA